MMKGRKLNLSKQEIENRRQRAFSIGLNKYWVGKKHSESAKRKLSEARRGTNNPYFGKKHPPEIIKKISEASRLNWQNENYRKTLLKKRQENNQTGENNPNWRGGSSDEVNYGPGWKKAKRLTLRRDGHKCQICGVQKGLFYLIELDVHHIIPFRINRDNSLKNLITVCRFCHGKMESAFINKIENENIDYQSYSFLKIKEQLIQSAIC